MFCFTVIGLLSTYINNNNEKNIKLRELKPILIYYNFVKCNFKVYTRVCHDCGCLLNLFVEVRLPSNVMLFPPSHLPVLSFKLDMEIIFPLLTCVVPTDQTENED